MMREKARHPSILRPIIARNCYPPFIHRKLLAHKCTRDRYRWRYQSINQSSINRPICELTLQNVPMGWTRTPPPCVRGLGTLSLLSLGMSWFFFAPPPLGQHHHINIFPKNKDSKIAIFPKADSKRRVFIVATETLQTRIL